MLERYRYIDINIGTNIGIKFLIRSLYGADHHFCKDPQPTNGSHRGNTTKRNGRLLG